MKSKRNPFRSVPSFIAAAVISHGSSAFATDYTWNSDLGAHYVGFWNDTTINGGQPVGGDTALITEANPDESQGEMS